MSENWKSLQHHYILGFLATWREKDGLSKLVGSMYGSSGKDDLGHGGYLTEEKDKKDEH